MKKSTFYALITVAGLALAGLICVQAYWINHAYSIKEQQFAQLVHTTINRITEDVQSYEVFQTIRELDMPYPHTDNLQEGVQKALLDTIIAGKKRRDNHHPRLSNNDKYTFWDNAVRNYWTPHSIIQQSVVQQSFVQQINSSGTSSSIISNSVSITQKPVKPADFRKVLLETTFARLQRADFRLEERIDQASLDYIVRSELIKSEIDQPYEYAVFTNNCSIQYQSKSFHPQKENELFSELLFPFDWFKSQPYYLNIYFPKQGNYLFKTIGFMSISSIVLTLIVIFAFSVAVYQMLRQKKITSIRLDFVNNITHELKTPISTISLASQMLTDDSIPNEKKNNEYISTVIADESKRLSQQVEKILQMAIFDHGKLILKFRNLDINQLIESVVNNMLLQIHNKNGEIETHLDAKQSMIEIDEVHYTNVMFNLIDNAIKYSKGRPDITVSTSDVPFGVKVVVEDKGIGINKTDQKRIFDQFYRVSTGDVHNVKGFGLGLSYVQKVVDAHNGKINIESELGQGTRFTIFLHRINTN